jgi:hypothetical protein
MEVIVTNVQASIEQESDVRAIVHKELSTGAPAGVAHRLRRCEVLPREMAFVPKLQDAGARGEDGFGGVEDGAPSRLYDSGINDWVKPGQPHQ